MNLLHRWMVTVCRHSWRAYGYANFSVKLDGLSIPIVGRMGLTNLDYQYAQFQAVLKAALAARPEGHVIDIGANIGRFLFNLTSIDRSQPYLGFEPLLPAAAYVRRVIAENCLGSHGIIAAALSDRHGTATIHFGAEDDVSATISDKMRPASMYSSQQLVATSTADSQLAVIPSIAFIKLDVEGVEIDVLRGMIETIKRHRPPFLIEVMPYAYLLDGTYDRGYFGELPEAEAKRVGNHRREHCLVLEAFFCERAYDFYSCSPKGHVSAVTTLDRGTSKDVGTDFLLLPRETAGVFLTHISG